MFKFNVFLRYKFQITFRINAQFFSLKQIPRDNNFLSKYFKFQNTYNVLTASKILFIKLHNLIKLYPDTT